MQDQKIKRVVSDRTVSIRTFLEEVVKEGPVAKRGLFKIYKESAGKDVSISLPYFISVVKDRTYRGALRVSADGKFIQSNI